MMAVVRPWTRRWIAARPLADASVSALGTVATQLGPQPTRTAP
jgi:hypothetical protein